MLENLAPPSPHIKSYTHFYNNLNNKINKWLENTLKIFKSEGLINFEPDVELGSANNYEQPTPDDEDSCRIKQETLAETLNMRLSLERYQAVWYWDIGQFPRITSRGSFIFNGKERCLIAQLAKSPGVFFTWEEKYESRGSHCDKVRYAVTELRPEDGIHLKFRMRIEPDAGPIQIVFPRGRTGYILTFLEALGFTDKEYNEIFKNNESVFSKAKQDRNKKTASGTKKDNIRHIAKCVDLGEFIKEKSLSNREQDKEISEQISKKFFSSFLGRLGRGQVNSRIKRTNPEYNESSEYITKGDISEILNVFIRFIDKDKCVPEDDPWDLGNLRVRLVGNYLDAALEHWMKRMEKKIRDSINEKKKNNEHVQINPQILKNVLEEANKDKGNTTLFNKCIKAWLQDSSMSQNIWVDQGNLLEAVELTRKITFNGKGGINIGHERLPRDFHWSHYGRLCPLDTPQSDDVGISLSITVGARINDLGVLETACYKVLHKDGTIKINDSGTYWLSPWDEVAQKSNAWIAFPDQKEELLKENYVHAHRGVNKLVTVPAREVGFIHASEDGMYSLAANLIPYRKHNDAVRGVMACGMIGQALPLKGGCAPKVKTGYESRIPEAYQFPYGSTTEDGEMAFGREILVGYLPWKGWNFEDAFVISTAAAEKLTDIQKKTIPIKLRRSLDGQAISFKKKKKELSGEIDLNRYGTAGVIKNDLKVSAKEQLVLEPGGSRRRGRKGEETTFLSHKVPKNAGGNVTSIKMSQGNGPAFLQFVITNYREAKIGDKLANRHGHKGVISKIYKNHEMPYFLIAKGGNGAETCACGETRVHRHLEMLINPLSVISRMNLGQLYETLETRSEEMKHLPEKVTCYDPAYDLNNYRRTIKNPILVGEQYIMKLNHNAVDKVHARSHIPTAYSAFVNQALKGKRFEGGQRLGEMEVWALMAHNASNIMQEMLTLKSDNPEGRKNLFQSILNGNEKITISDARLPDALKTLVALCYGIGILMTLSKKDGTTAKLFEEQYSPEEIASMKLSLLDSEQFKNRVSQGEINTFITSGKDHKPRFKYHPQGLESEQVFGPVKSYTCACGKYSRYVDAIGKLPHMVCEDCNTSLLPSDQRRLRMGHIKLALPVPNPFFLSLAGEELRDVLGVNPMECKLVFEDKPIIKFEGKDKWKDVHRFLTLAFSSSEQFKDAIDRKIGGPIEEESLSNSETLKARITKNMKLEKLEEMIMEVVQENCISGIDLITDMLKAKEETRHLCLDFLPVIPPELRRPFKIKDVMYKRNDLNVLYKAVLSKNTDLVEMISNDRDENDNNKKKYMKLRKDLQIAVSRLFCNHRLQGRNKRYDLEAPGRPVVYSLSSYIEGKEGLIVGNLLGKRVDYSGRAVIVPDPNLSLDECRIPFKLALKLFRPQLMAEMGVSAEKDKDSLLDRALAGDSKVVDELKPKLEAIISKHNILLNRQPTLHRLGLLGFKPMLGDDAVIATPPLITEGYNADYDGDTMAVYLPLTIEAKQEIPRLFPSHHICHPANGRYTLSIAQDLALGGYLNNGNTKKEIVKEFETYIQDSELLDKIETFKKEAFEKATHEGVSFSICDFKEIADTCKTGNGNSKQVEDAITSSSNVFKDVILSGARGDWDTMVYLLGKVYDRKGSNLTQGLTIGEQFDQAFSGRRNLVDTQLGTAEGGSLTKNMVSLAQHLWISEEDCGVSDGIPVSKEEEFWLLVDEIPGDMIKKEIGSINGSEVTQLLWDEKGYMKSDDFYTDVANKSDLEQMYKEHPERIPRRLIGVRIKRKIAEKDEDVKKLLYLRLYGRILAEDFNGFKKGACLGNKSVKEIADKIVKNGSAVYVRNPLSCESKTGICRYCYGLPWNRGRYLDWGIADLVSIDTRIGMIAAQAVGEPGTQMALRKKHIPRMTDQDDSNRSVEINEVKKYFQSNSPLLVEKVQVSYAQHRDTVDLLYRVSDKMLATIHFEVLLKGMLSTLNNKKDGNAGWISSAAHPDRHLKNKQGKILEGDTLHVLAVSAFHNISDSLDDLKGRALIGASLPESQKEEDIG